MFSLCFLQFSVYNEKILEPEENRMNNRHFMTEKLSENNNADILIHNNRTGKTGHFSVESANTKPYDIKMMTGKPPVHDNREEESQ